MKSFGELWLSAGGNSTMQQVRYVGYMVHRLGDHMRRSARRAASPSFTSLMFAELPFLAM
jgi:hypothetical protein